MELVLKTNYNVEFVYFVLLNKCLWIVVYCWLIQLIHGCMHWHPQVSQGTISQAINRYHNSTVSFTHFSKIFTESFCAILLRAKFELGFANAVIIFVALANQSFMIASNSTRPFGHVETFSSGRTITSPSITSAVGQQCYVTYIGTYVYLTRKDLPTWMNVLQRLRWSTRIFPF